VLYRNLPADRCAGAVLAGRAEPSAAHVKVEEASFVR
jgi:hypothetical protein